MEDAAAWVSAVSGVDRPVLVAYPVAFDWSILYWYFEQFARDGSPFGHSSCLDIRTLYQAITGAVFDRSGKSSMAESVQAREPHTHHALDDAVEQGELFANLMEHVARRRSDETEAEDGEPSWLAQHVLPIA
jgi:hypothetical protein